MQTESEGDTAQVMRGALPKIRFPGFEENWQSEPLGNLCIVLNNQRKPVASVKRVSGPYPYYGASGIVDFISEFLFDERLVLVGEDGAKWGAYENTAFIASGKYWVNNHAHVLRPQRIVDALLVSYLTMTDLAPFVTGAAPPKLTLDNLKKIRIPFPPLCEEQRKISDCLSFLDACIGTETRKLDALKAHKQGLMQKLFPAEGQSLPRLRFSGFEDKWEAKLLKDVSPLQRGFDLPSNKLRQGKVPVVYSNGVQNFHDTGIAVAPGIVTGRSGTIGKINFIGSGKYWPHNTSLWVTSFCGNVPLFVYYLFNFIGMERFVSGSGVPTLNRNDVHIFQTHVPSPAEQNRIATCLSSMDDLLAAQSRKIDALRQHKKGLTQGLFPGIEVHVP